MSNKGLLTHNFGGIDAKASRLNIAPNEAETIVNWDIGIEGAITRRLGCLKLTSSSLGTPFYLLGRFFGTDNTEYFVAVANGAVYRSTDCATWTDVTGSLTLTGTGRYHGAAWRNKLIVVNGTDEPFYVAQTGNADTLKNASILSAPQVVSQFTVTGSNGSAPADKAMYMVTATTARGETAPSGVITNPTVGNSGPAGTSGSAYNTIYWTPVDGATGYNIYVASTTYDWSADVNASGTTATVVAGRFVLRDTVDPGLSSYNDTKGTVVFGRVTGIYTAVPYSAPLTNDAYLTPEDWETNGSPEIISIIGRGRDERALASRGNTVWASGMGNPFNWLTANDAFVWTINSGVDNRITAHGTLFDYTVLFTRTDCYVYTGASGSTITLVKQIPIGCPSHTAIVNVGDDFYCWSQHGPTTLKRIMSGADIQSTTDFNRNIQPLVFNSTATDQWSKIVCYNIPGDNRVAWWVPSTGSTTNDYALVYQYDVNAWTSYDSWSPVSCVRASDGRILAGFDDGHVYRLHYGYSDNGSPIQATYTTGNLDIASWAPVKRIPWVDVIMDRTAGAYTLQFEWNMDAGRQTGGPVVLTQTTTSTAPIVITGPNMNYHRIHTYGIGNTCQLTFTANALGQGVKILGWLTEVAAKGRRE